MVGIEASDVPETLAPAQSSLTGTASPAILTGKPVESEGFFHRVHKDLSQLVTRNVPQRGGVVKDMLRIRTAQGVHAGVGRDSNAYRIRSRASPHLGRRVVIRSILVETSPDPRGPSGGWKVIWGLDCARFGSNAGSVQNADPPPRICSRVAGGPNWTPPRTLPPA